MTFKSTGAIPIRYKKQFGTDFFAELSKIKMEGDEINISSMDFETFYNIAWTLAKTADKNIPSPEEWLDGFDAFPIADILPEIQDLLVANIQSKKPIPKQKKK